MLAAPTISPMVLAYLTGGIHDIDGVKILLTKSDGPPKSGWETCQREYGLCSSSPEWILYTQNKLMAELETIPYAKEFRACFRPIIRNLLNGKGEWLNLDDPKKTRQKPDLVTREIKIQSYSPNQAKRQAIVRLYDVIISHLGQMWPPIQNDYQRLLRLLSEDIIPAQHPTVPYIPKTPRITIPQTPRIIIQRPVTIPPKLCRRKTKIPKTLREEVWTYYTGQPFQKQAESRCFCCDYLLYCNDMLCGHIIPECLQGPTTRDNLRPICFGCNKDMTTMHMFEYILESGAPGGKNFVQEPAWAQYKHFWEMVKHALRQVKDLFQAGRITQDRLLFYEQ